ncbi:MAG: hypothetical protein OEZ03_12775, partial [Alphaproteobacteria bacterium]|nr:hypothetical protein [Alphaproteobacteria bacterium]
MAGTTNNPARPLDAEASDLLTAFEAEVLAKSPKTSKVAPALDELISAQRIFGASPELRSKVVLRAYHRGAAARPPEWGRDETLLFESALSTLVYRLIGDGADFTLSELRAMLDDMTHNGYGVWWHGQDVVFAAIDRFTKQNGMNPEFLEYLRWMGHHYTYLPYERKRARIRSMRLMNAELKKGNVIGVKTTPAGEIVEDNQYPAADMAFAEAMERWRGPYRAYSNDQEPLLMADRWRSLELGETPGGAVALDGNPAGHRALLHLAMEDYAVIAGEPRATDLDSWREWSVKSRIREKLIRHILEKGFELSAADILKLLPLADDLFQPGSRMLHAFVDAVERFLTSNQPTSNMINILKTLRLKHIGHTSDERQRLAGRLTRILAPWFMPGLVEETAWGNSVIEWLDGLGGEEKQDWTDLLTHMKTSEGKAKPAKKWLKDADARIAAVGREEFAERLALWLAEFTPDPAEPEPNADMLKGMIWAAAQIGGDSLAVAIGRFCETCYKKVPGWGARSMKLGNACLYALGQMGERGVAELVRVRGRMKYVQARQQLEKALTGAAERAGLSVIDLEEIALPDFGLGPDDTLTEILGDATAEIRIEGSDEVTLNWTGADGKPRKSLPV